METDGICPPKNEISNLTAVIYTYETVHATADTVIKDVSGQAGF